MSRTKTRKSSNPRRTLKRNRWLRQPRKLGQKITAQRNQTPGPKGLLPAILTESNTSVTSEGVVDTNLIDQAVPNFINDKYNENAYKMAIEIGAYVLKYFFNNDISLAASKNPNKPTSYRALCRNERLIPRPEALSVMVRVAAQEKSPFLEKDLDTASLSYSHKAELVKLPNDAAKVKFVKSVMQKALSSRELEQKVKAIRKKDGDKPKSLTLILDTAMDNPRKLFAEATVLEIFQDTALLQEELTQLRKKKLRKLCEQAMKRAEETQRWSHFYQTLVDTIEEITQEE